MKALCQVKTFQHKDALDIYLRRLTSRKKTLHEVSIITRAKKSRVKPILSEDLSLDLLISLGVPKAKLPDCVKIIDRGGAILVQKRLAKTAFNL